MFPTSRVLLYLVLFTRLSHTQIFYHRLNPVQLPESNLSLFGLVQLLYSCFISRHHSLCHLLLIDLRRDNRSEGPTFLCYLSLVSASGPSGKHPLHGHLRR